MVHVAQSLGPSNLINSVLILAAKLSAPDSASKVDGPYYSVLVSNTIESTS